MQDARVIEEEKQELLKTVYQSVNAEKDNPATLLPMSLAYILRKSKWAQQQIATEMFPCKPFDTSIHPLLLDEV